MEEELYQIKPERKVFSRIGWACFAAMGTAVLAQFAMVWAAGYFHLALDNSLLSAAVSVVSMYVVGLGVLLLLLRLLRAPVYSAPKQRRIGAGTFFTCFIIGYGLLYAGNLTGQGVVWLIDSLLGIPYDNYVSGMIMDTNLWQALLVYVLIAPAAEEFMFRKLLIDRLGRYGEAVAVFVSALMFGLFHGNLFQFFYAFGIGLVLGYLYVKSGRLWYSILLHAIINFLGSALPLLLFGGIDLDAITAQTAALDPALLARLMLISLYGFAMIGFAIAGVVILICVRKRIVLDKGAVIIPKGKRFKTIALNTGMILFVLLCIGLFALAFING